MRKITAGVVIGIIALGIWAMTWTNTTDYKIEEIKSVEVEEKVVEKKPILLKELIKICTCESGQGTGKPQQYNIRTGEVLRGEINSQDIGMCQINLFWNGETAKKMGLDLFKESDNITFANWLYTTQGAEPWNWSKGCWQ